MIGVEQVARISHGNWGASSVIMQTPYNAIKPERNKKEPKTRQAQALIKMGLKMPTTVSALTTMVSVLVTFAQNT